MNYQNKYKDFNLNSSLKRLDNNKFSPNQFYFKKKEKNQ